MRAPTIALVVIVAVGAAFGGTACSRGGHIQNLPLAWRGGKLPLASPTVASAFSLVPFRFGMRDMRPDPSVVGRYQHDGWVVRTTDDVAQYCSNRLGEMLTAAGARLGESPVAMVEAELLEYHVIEAGRFHGLMRMRAIVHSASGRAWSRVYEGRARRWGRTHSPDKFNEALSIALTDIVRDMVNDDGFARALMGEAGEGEGEGDGDGESEGEGEGERDGESESERDGDSERRGDQPARAPTTSAAPSGG